MQGHKREKTDPMSDLEKLRRSVPPWASDNSVRGGIAAPRRHILLQG